jgi:hypothetical protein
VLGASCSEDKSATSSLFGAGAELISDLAISWALLDILAALDSAMLHPWYVETKVGWRRLISVLSLAPAFASILENGKTVSSKTTSREM